LYQKDKIAQIFHPCAVPSETLSPDFGKTRFTNALPDAGGRGRDVVGRLVETADAVPLSSELGANKREMSRYFA
jgi:hypothetical protein